MDIGDCGPERSVLEELIAAKKLPKPQQLRQQAELDCSVPVFAALAEISDDEVRRDVPKATAGEATVDEWVRWLEARGFKVSNRAGCPDDVLPCAHLVSAVTKGPPFHWIFRDRDGDVHDPSPVCAQMPASDPFMRNLSMYARKVLTLSVSAPPSNV